MDVLLSVILAHKDRNHLLEMTLKNWRHQRGNAPQWQFQNDNIELIVVDDGSERPPMDICEKYKARVVLLGDSQRKNPSAAWNAGLRIANGKVLACTHAEIVPNLDCARYLYGSCVGEPEYMKGLRVWAPYPSRPEDGLVEKEIEGEEIKRLGEWAIRANVSVYRLRASSNRSCLDEGFDPDCLQNDSEFWYSATDFGGHSNFEIKHQLRGYFWNNLWACRKEVFNWCNYLSEPSDWGADDSDFQNRQKFLKLGYVFSDVAVGYHQYHDARFRGGCDDFGHFNSLEEARLGNDSPLNLKRGDFWSDAI